MFKTAISQKFTGHHYKWWHLSHKTGWKLAYLFKNTNSDRYPIIFLWLSYWHQFLQKHQFYYNISFKLYIQLHFLGNSEEAFPKNML